MTEKTLLAQLIAGADTDTEMDNSCKKLLSHKLILAWIYYCCRMLSAQYGTVFTHSKYDKLRKVYSIWICTSPPKYRENSITKYGLFEQNLLGKVRELRKNYDLLSILIICLKKENIPVPEKNNLIDMLSTLLSPILSADEKENILENQFNIPMTKEIKEDMMDMCNISRSIRIDGIKEGFSQGISQGISKGRLEDLRSLMTNLKLTASQAMDALSIPPEERQYYLQNIS